MPTGDLGPVAATAAGDRRFRMGHQGLGARQRSVLHEVTLEALGRDRSAAVISGPSFAVEVARGLPTAVTVAAWDVGHARRVATVLHGSNLRAYTSNDVIGVELGGAVKNVLAIAAGIADGLGFWGQCPGGADHPRVGGDGAVGRGRGWSARNLHGLGRYR